MEGITLTNNRFGRDTKNLDCAIIIGQDQPRTASGNVWADSLQPVRLRTG